MTDTPDFDFGRNESNLKLGIELEWPLMEHGKPMVSRGYNSDNLRTSMGPLPSSLDANKVYDGTVGLEIVSSPIDVADADDWYYEVVEYVKDEYNAGFQPTGLLANGSTAGAHVHISPLTESQAQRLADLSQEPWMKVLFCTSIALDEDETATWPVFRGGDYCRPGYVGHHNSRDESHYRCVNRRADTHYEWRMPEPMEPENVTILARFLSLFEQSEELAIEYAQELLDSGDDRITSVKRAEKIGMDIEDVPQVEREPVPETADFFGTVREGLMYPEIHTVQHDGDFFYVLDSQHSYVTGVEVGNEEVRFSANDVLYADTLEQADDDIGDEVMRMYNRVENTFRETEATKTLKQIVKEKKGTGSGNSQMGASA